MVLNAREAYDIFDLLEELTSYVCGSVIVCFLIGGIAWFIMKTLLFALLSKVLVVFGVFVIICLS